jgi:hypothetical protein
MAEPRPTTAKEAARLRQEIRAELETTREAYHALLNSLSADDWRKPSGNPAWTVGQVIYHMTMAPRMLPSDVRMIRRGRRAPGLPAFIFDSLNVLVTRWGARKHTPQSVGQAYDAAHAAALAAFETIQDHEWAKGIEYPDWDPMLSGFVTIERLFRYLPLHFEVHAEQIRQALATDSSPREPNS